MTAIVTGISIIQKRSSSHSKMIHDIPPARVMTPASISAIFILFNLLIPSSL